MKKGKSCVRGGVISGLVLMMLCGCDGLLSHKSKMASEQKTAEDVVAFSVPSLSEPGTNLDLAAFSNQAVVLDFWASWCKPCLSELPVLNALYADYKAKGVVVIGLLLDTDPADVLEQTMRTLQVDYPVGMGASLVNEGLFADVRVIPTKYFLDRNHRLVGDPVTGVVSESALRERMDALLLP